MMLRTPTWLVDPATMESMENDLEIDYGTPLLSSCYYFSLFQLRNVLVFILASLGGCFKLELLKRHYYNANN